MMVVEFLRDVLFWWLVGDLVVLVVGLVIMVRRQVRGAHVLAVVVMWPYHVVLVVRDLVCALVYALRPIFEEAGREVFRFLSWW